MVASSVPMCAASRNGFQNTTRLAAVRVWPRAEAPPCLRTSGSPSTSIHFCNKIGQKRPLPREGEDSSPAAHRYIADSQPSSLWFLGRSCAILGSGFEVTFPKRRLRWRGVPPISDPSSRFSNKEPRYECDELLTSCQRDLRSRCAAAVCARRDRLVGDGRWHSDTFGGELDCMCGCQRVGVARSYGVSPLRDMALDQSDLMGSDIGSDKSRISKWPYALRR